ncbi:MAG: bifunctional nicotinamidase/pyrazinamidase [Nitrospirales bacterium]|nr:bifunctional nicotinamidase/pyrazinamidase [Nitrospirales bacterium]
MKLVKKSTPSPSEALTNLHPEKNSVLILVHVQNDFCPGGALPVTEGDTIIPLINRYIGLFQSEGLSVIATRDWHPPNHCSFKEQGGMWPVHCVQGSRGAQFRADLHIPNGSLIISGATNPKTEAYSAFDGTSLNDHLEDMGAQTLYVVGLATDYCVKQTVLDGCKLGYRIVVLEDAVRGVNLRPDDSQKALKEMSDAGALKASASDLGLDS